MNKIVVYRTHIEINDYDLGDCPNLERTFSIYEQTYHKNFPKGRVYDSEKRILMLPRGIDIGYLERLFNSDPVISADVDPMGDIKPVMLKYKPRDEDQMEAIKFMLSMDKYKYTERATMKSINLNTGKGKTYCAIAVTAFFGFRPIVITDNIGWLEQWKKFFIEYTDISEEEIYLIAGAPSLMKLFNRDISKYKVILSTHSTIRSVGEKQGWDTVREFFKHCQIGIKFYDEAHLNFDNMIQIDCYSNTFLTFYLTATPGRSDWKENSIFNLCFKNVPSIDLFHNDIDPHTKYAAIKFNSNPSPIDATKCKNNYGLNRTVYTNYLVRTDEFRMLLNILLDKAMHKYGRFLFYIGTNDAILYVRDLIYQDFPIYKNHVGIYTSLTKPEDKATELQKKIILSTTKSAGAAMDIKGLVEVINLAEPFKSKILAQQTFGRCRDSNTIYKDIVDMGFHYTKKFYDCKKPVFKKFASECVEINLSDKELEDRYEAILDKKLTRINPFTYCDE